MLGASVGGPQVGSGPGNTEGSAADGAVDVGDYGVWQLIFGHTAGSGLFASGAVPEPASVVMLLVASLMLFFCRSTRVGPGRNR